MRVAGELDIATAAQLQRTLREPRLQARLVVLDLRELEFIDSSGVHAIVNASIHARRAGHRLVLLRGPPNGDRVFALTGGSWELDTSERVVRTIVFATPPAALLLAGWLAWGGTLHWQDLLVLAITYTLTGLGITVGYHRLLTHRCFKTTRLVRALLAVLGSMAVEGPVIEWVATHRKHDRFSDHPGDPHSPHLDPAPGWRGALRGFGHAHLGSMFAGKEMANPARYAKDLLADRDLRLISRTFPLWVIIALERCHLASDVIRISPARQQAKREAANGLGARQVEVRPRPSDG